MAVFTLPSVSKRKVPPGPTRKVSAAAAAGERERPTTGCCEYHWSIHCRMASSVMGIPASCPACGLVPASGAVSRRLRVIASVRARTGPACRRILRCWVRCDAMADLLFSREVTLNEPWTRLHGAWPVLHPWFYVSQHGESTKGADGAGRSLSTRNG